MNGLLVMELSSETDDVWRNHLQTENGVGGVGRNTLQEQGRIELSSETGKGMGSSLHKTGGWVGGVASVIDPEE